MLNPILIVDDEQDFLDSVRRGLLGAGFKTLRLESDPRNAAAAVENGDTFDVALLDINMPWIDGLQLLERIKNASPGTECIMVSAINEAKVAVDCLKKGAYDYMTKPVNRDDMVAAIRRALERKRLLEVIAVVKSEAPPEIAQSKIPSALIARSEKMLRLLKEADLYASITVPLLITGQKGTGKETIARYVHDSGSQKAGPFAVLDLESLKGDQHLAALFGNEREAGYIDRARKGTLFLDEISYLPSEVQTMLLKAMQEGGYTRPGTDKKCPLDARLIISTRLDPDALISKGELRKDLYYFVKGSTLILPSLKERKGDIPLLVEQFVSACAGERDLAVAQDAMSTLCDYDFPGNIPELENIVKEMLAKTTGSAITRDSLPDSIRAKIRVKFLAGLPVPKDLLKNLNKDYLIRERWCPLEISGTRIVVIIDSLDDLMRRDEIQTVLKTKAVDYRPAEKEDIFKFIHHFYSKLGGEVELRDMIEKGTPEESGPVDDEPEITETDNIVPQIMNKIINEAFRRRASDIHIEPNLRERRVDIRFRIDGDLTPYEALPFNYRTALVSRIKIMAGIDITEKRLPQDGKIKFRCYNGETIELRVATLPIGGLEDAMLRLLATGELLKLEDVHLDPLNYEHLLAMSEKPHGLILCVGPTGSGKTTTLHALVEQIKRPALKIITIEDPIEISQPGIRQVQVNRKIGLDFAAAMRSFLRSDPDIVMVGEMRDPETAKIGTEASLTGHLVLSTLHTNDAPETVVRLLDMGLDPFHFGDSLIGIISQRLVRSLCQRCRESYVPTEIEFRKIQRACGEEFIAATLEIAGREQLKLYRSQGCDACGGTGYWGRIAIHEVLVATEPIRRIIQKRGTVAEVREKAVSEGMILLLQDGIKKAMMGLTDFDQLRRVSMR
jgi:type II secretory ATPase GspE/PulE/Tfp pilus assembly ATPase PilB-like protein/CheY-like chemotaxis protein